MAFRDTRPRALVESEERDTPSAPIEGMVVSSPPPPPTPAQLLELKPVLTRVEFEVMGYRKGWRKALRRLYELMEAGNPVEDDKGKVHWIGPTPQDNLNAIELFMKVAGVMEPSALKSPEVEELVGGNMKSVGGASIRAQLAAAVIQTYE